MGEPTEISDRELSDWEKACELRSKRDVILRLVAALRSTRKRAEKAEREFAEFKRYEVARLGDQIRDLKERLAAAEAVCETAAAHWNAWGGEDQEAITQTRSAHKYALLAWRALAHPTTEEPTE